MSLAFNNWHSFFPLLFGDITWKIYYLPDQWISRCSVSPCTRSALSTGRKTSLSEHGCSWFLTHKTYIKAACSITLCSTSSFLHLCVYLVNSWFFRLVIKRRNYFQNYRIILIGRATDWPKYTLLLAWDYIRSTFLALSRHPESCPAALWAAADDSPTTQHDFCCADTAPLSVIQLLDRVSDLPRAHCCWENNAVHT